MPRNNSIVKTCSIETCDGKHVARGFCRRHYVQWNRRVNAKTKTFIRDDNARFDSYIELVPFSTCWYWVGPIKTGGYGFLTIAGKNQHAHRYSYERYVGPIPEGSLILHSCDTPCCVNPNHLAPGTQAENLRQMIARGRGARGIKHGSAKLTEQQVLEIRASTETISAISRQYGIARPTIDSIKSRKTWKHI